MKNYILFALLVVAISLDSAAQVSTSETPYSWTDNKTDFQPYESVRLPEFDVEALRDEDETLDFQKDVPLRFGYIHEGEMDLIEGGTWQTLANGNRLMRIEFESEDAYTMNFTFSNFNLPEGAKLWAYSSGQTMYRGAFSADNNQLGGAFAIGIVSGDKVTIELLEPQAVEGQSELVISHIVHDYRNVYDISRGFDDSGSCNNDVICPEGNGWRDQISSVAMITTEFGSRICTGALVNNVNEDGTPYFLTANHCLGSGVSSWVFYFNYDSPNCSPSSDGPLNQSISGCQLRASNGGSDFGLLELNSVPPASYEIYYSGWDRSGNFPTSQVGIHHPSGDVKKITFDNDAALQANWGGAATWRIATWEDGTTEPGSSGSPLFDQNQRIIGQLYGGTASCSNNIDDYYGRFDISWDGPSAASRLYDWLDPSNSVSVLDGYDPNTPSVAIDVGVQSVESPTGVICGDAVTPEIVVRNYGSDPISSFDVLYSIDGGANQNYAWTGTLASGATINITLPVISGIGAGNHTFNANTSSPNNQSDENLGNDGANSAFDLFSSSVILNLDFLTDNYSEENTWELIDNQSNVIYSGGPYPNDQTLYTEQLCVGEGCYTFAVYDSYGDGMQYNGVVGDYTLSVDGGAILATMVSGGDFGSEAAHSFCLTQGCTDPVATNYNSAANVDDGSCFYDPVQADFSANPLTITAGQSVSFTNLSSGAVSDYNWSFPGGTPSSSTQENPVVVFNNEGFVDVTLNVSGPGGSDTELKSAYINVLPPSQNCITAFPVIDNFDNLTAGTSNLNADWQQDSNDDFDWLVGSGTTPSNNTGPGNDHTTESSAGRYLYTEASDPNFPAKSAVLVSPCIDISSISSNNPHVSFYYHMYGASMGQLHVDLFANGSWIDNFFVVSGNQGNQWLQANLSLDGYSGVVQLRFRATTGTGNQGWQSDMAIDDFMVYEFVAIPGCTDPAANNYNPLANEDDGSCDYGCAANEDLFQIAIVEDNYPGETTWELVDENNALIASGTTNSLDICVEQDNCYTFTIFDTYGDGICCGYGNGSYTLSLNGNQIAAGGEFSFEESVQFNCAPGSTCSEGIAVSEGLHTAAQPDTWYIYTPAVNGQYSISTCSQGNTCDTKIFLYDYCAGLSWDDTNAGTIAYNDDFCGVQSEITPFLEGGVTYYLRIGDDGTSCSNSSINFEISYVGGIAGCMDPLACNYSPLATETGPCYYNNDPNCENLGPDLDVLADVFYNSMYLTTISATQNNNYTCLIDEGCVGGYGTRDIVRFTTHIKNIGNQDYYIGSPNNQAGQFEWDPCHGHWHYEGYAEYVLYDDAGEELPYIGFKNGFCVLDLECSDGGTAKFTCGNMGITAGCGDYYSSSLACQWLDLTDVPAGDYTMVVKVNWDQSPDALGRYELAYDNNWAHVCISFDRDANGDIINFTKSQGDCIIIEDCVGQPFGNSQPDCEGNCPGFVVTGDINNSGEMDVIDVQEYLTGILGNDIPVSACTDVNMSGDITVADAAILSDCNIYGEEEIIFGGVHNHCIFGPEVINPDHTTTLSIGDANFDQNYIDIYVQNPDNEILGYQFTMSGIDISGVESLIDPQQYPVTPQFLFGSNEIIALSLEDSTISKFVNPTPLLRIHYLSLTAEQVCIEQIVDIVNEHTESVLTIAGPCFETNFNEPIADFSFDADEICEGGTVNFTDLSSNQPTSWLWSFPGGTPSSSTLQNPTVTYNTPGVHNVSLTATNQYGSDVHLAIDGIVVYDNPVLSATFTPVLCNGEATGAINLNVSGGQSPFIYDWSNGFDQEDPVGLTAGQYSVTVTDINDCFASTSLLITQPSVLVLAEVSNSPSSCGSADGSAIVAASGGASNYSYSWQPGNLSGAAQTELTPGNYSVAVTDGNLCSTSIDVLIGSSGLVDCFGDCNGTAYLDNCNDCVGGNTGVDPCTADCNGDFGGTAYVDDCGDCVSGNTGADPCQQDCNGDWGGSAYLDNCNDCVGGNTGVDPCTADCNGDFGGTAYVDDCGDCVSGNTGADPCQQDCNGDWGGSAYLDNCNDCVGGNTGVDPCTADCNGDFGGTAYMDDCGDCVGGNTGADPCQQDCNGDWGGSAYLDNCNDCVGGNTGVDPCTADCNGDFGGTAYLDDCGDCVSGNTGADPCQQDCNGDWGGSAYLDNCNDCVGGNTGVDPCTADCNGDFGGTAYMDDCGDCVGGNTGADPCQQDCNGDWGGSAYLDNCNDCVGGNTGVDPCIADCNGDFGGTAVIDNCGDCVGGNTSATACLQDCNSEWGGTAYLDDCNVCVGGNTGLEPCIECNLTLSSTSVSAEVGYANGSATVIASGGQEPYTYQWDDPFMQTTSTAVGLFPGNYNCTITDDFGCTAQIEVNISLFLDISGTQVHQNYCNTIGYELSDFISCNAVDDADAYRWEFVEQGVGPLPEFTRYDGNKWLRLMWIDGIQMGTTYEVRVKARANGIWGEYDAMCTITTAANLPLTEVRPQYHPTNSSGVNYNLCDFIIAYNVDAANNFRWRFDPDTDPNNGNEIIFVSGNGNPAVRLYWVNNLIPGSQYHVAVEARVGLQWTGYGPVHMIQLAQPPVPSLRSGYCDQFYAPNGYVLSTSVCDANYYEFQFTNLETEVVSSITSGNYVAYLNNASPSLIPGEYAVWVRVNQAGVLGDFGTPCAIFIEGPPNQEQGDTYLRSVEMESQDVLIYPNPNEGNEVYIQIDNLKEGNHDTTIEMYDVFGHRITAQKFSVNGRTVNKVIHFDHQLAAGMYFVHIFVDDERWATQSVVVQY